MPGDSLAGWPTRELVISHPNITKFKTNHVLLTCHLAAWSSLGTEPGFELREVGEGGGGASFFV